MPLEVPLEVLQLQPVGIEPPPQLGAIAFGHLQPAEAAVQINHPLGGRREVRSAVREVRDLSVPGGLSREELFSLLVSG
jgi:hypothetical protein